MRECLLDLVAQRWKAAPSSFYKTTHTLLIGHFINLVTLDNNFTHWKAFSSTKDLITYGILGDIRASRHLSSTANSFALSMSTRSSGLFGLKKDSRLKTEEGFYLNLVTITQYFFYRIINIIYVCQGDYHQGNLFSIA